MRLLESAIITSYEVSRCITVYFVVSCAQMPSRRSNRPSIALPTAAELDILFS